MTNQPHAFKDKQGMPWALTVLPAVGNQFVLESTNASIFVVAKQARITLDETCPADPFVLELDENTSIAIDEKTMEKLDEFLQAVAA